MADKSGRAAFSRAPQDEADRRTRLLRNLGLYYVASVQSPENMVLPPLSSTLIVRNVNVQRSSSSMSSTAECPAVGVSSPPPARPVKRSICEIDASVSVTV